MWPLIGRRLSTAVVVAMVAALSACSSGSAPEIEGLLVSDPEFGFYGFNDRPRVHLSPEGGPAVLTYDSMDRVDLWLPGSAPVPVLDENSGLGLIQVIAVVDAQVILSSYRDRLWSVALADGTMTRLPDSAPRMRVQTLQIDSDTVLVYQDDTLQLWSPDTPLELEPLTAPGVAEVERPVYSDAVVFNDDYFLTHHYSPPDAVNDESILEVWSRSDREATTPVASHVVATEMPLSMALTNDNKALLVTTTRPIGEGPHNLTVWDIDKDTVQDVPVGLLPSTIDVLPNGVIALGAVLPSDDPTIEDPLNRLVMQFLDPDTFEVVAQRRGREYEVLSPGGDGRIFVQMAQRVDMENTEDPDDFRRVYGVELWDVDEFSGQ